MFKLCTTKWRCNHIPSTKHENVSGEISCHTVFFLLTLACRWILSPRKGHRHQVSPALKGPSPVPCADLWNIKASGTAETMWLERLSAVASGRPQREKASKVEENQCGWFTHRVVCVYVCICVHACVWVVLSCVIKEKKTFKMDAIVLGKNGCLAFMYVKSKNPNPKYFLYGL